MTAGITIMYTESSGTNRRLRFEPREKSTDTYERITERWTGCSWRVEGREIVQYVNCELAASEILARR